MKKVYNAISTVFCFVAGMWIYKTYKEQNTVLFFVWLLTYIFNFLLIIENTKDE